MYWNSIVAKSMSVIAVVVMLFSGFVTANSHSSGNTVIAPSNDVSVNNNNPTHTVSQISDSTVYGATSDVTNTATKGSDVVSAEGAVKNSVQTSNPGNEPNIFSAKDHEGASMANALGYTGNGVKVGILDNGIDFGTPDLNNTFARIQPYDVTNDIIIKSVNTGTTTLTQLSYVSRLAGSVNLGTLVLYENGVKMTSGYTAFTNGTIVFSPAIPAKTQVSADYVWHSAYEGWPEAYDASSMEDYFSTTDYNTTGMWYADTSIVAKKDSNGWLHLDHTIKVDGTNDFIARDWQTPDYRIYSELQLKGRNSATDSDTLEPNLDVSELYSTGDASNWYFGFNAYATNWNMWYAIYFDTDIIAGSGAKTDPMGNYVDLNNMTFLPEYALYLKHDGNNTMETGDFFAYNPSTHKWNASQPLTSIGGMQAFNSGNHFMELSIPKSVFGSNLNAMQVSLFTLGDQNAVNTLIYSPTSDTLISGGNDYQYRKWNPTSGAMLQAVDTGEIRGFAFSPDGTKLAVACGNKTGKNLPPILIYDVATGKVIQQLQGHTDKVSAVAWSHNGTWIASGGYDKVVRLWDTRTWKEITIATWNDVKNGSGSHFNNSFDDLTLTGNTPLSHSGSITGIQWSPDDTKIVTTSEDKTVKVWSNLFGGKATYDNRLIFKDKTGKTLLTHDDIVTGVDWSTANNNIATCSADKSVKIWDGSTGSLIQKLVGHNDTVTSVKWSPDGTKLLTTSNDDTFRIWNTADWTSKVVKLQYKLVSGVWSKDGSKVIIASSEATDIWVYDSTSLSVVTTITGHIHTPSRPQNNVPWNLDTPNTPDNTGLAPPNWSAIPVQVVFQKIYHPDASAADGLGTTIYVGNIPASKSGNYHVGYLPDDNVRQQLANPPNTFYPTIVVVDTQTAGVYDKVYMNLTSDSNPQMDNNQVAYKGHEVAILDKTGDGYPDVSGGMLYYIADGTTPLPYSNTFILGKADASGNPLKNKIPLAGNLVAFMFDSVPSSSLVGTVSTGSVKGNIAGSDGTAAASAVVGQGKSIVKDTVNGGTPVAVCTGMAPNAKIVAIRIGSGEDDTMGKALLYSVTGLDGVPSTGDEAQVVYYGTMGSTKNPGYAATSRLIDYYSATYGQGHTVFVVPAGDSGPGYGTLTPPAGGSTLITAGVATDLFYGYFDGTAGKGPYRSWGDVLPSSSRGSSTLGTQGVDVVASGSWLFASVPVYAVIDPTDAIWDKHSKCDFWSGTNPSAAVSAGLVTLIDDAYYQKHGTWPTIDQIKELVMNSADNINYDTFAMGSGYANAYRGVELAADLNGISVSPSYWVPGDYRGVKHTGFTNLMYTADDPSTPWKECTQDTQNFTITNHNTTSSTDVNLKVNVFEKYGEKSWTFGPGSTDWWMDIRPYIPSDCELLKIVGHTTHVISGTEQYWLRVYDGVSTTAHPPSTNTASTLVTRISQDTRSASELEVRVHDPLSRSHTALWVSLAPASSTSPFTEPWNLTIEFYKNASWSWVNLDKTSITLPPSGSTEVTATIAIPSDAPIGTYEAAIYATEIKHVTSYETILNPTSYTDNNFKYNGMNYTQIDISLTPVQNEMISTVVNLSEVLLAHAPVYPISGTGVYNKTLSESIKEHQLTAVGGEKYVMLSKANKYYYDINHRPHIYKNGAEMAGTTYSLKDNGNLTFITPLGVGDIINATYFWNKTNYVPCTWSTINGITGAVMFSHNVTLYDILYVNYSFSNFPYSYAQLANSNITTIKLYSNSTLMNPAGNFTVNYITGFINFTRLIKVSEVLTVNYTYFTPAVYIELAHGYQKYTAVVKDFSRIVPGSVRLFNGTTLIPSSDYTVDYMNGIIYFNIAPRPGANVQALYNYSFDTTIPVTVNVATHNTMFNFGGNSKYNGPNLLYNNNDTFAGNDVRQFYSDIADDANGFNPTSNTKFYVSADWSYNQTKYSFYTIGKSSRDKAADGNESRFGAYTLTETDENLIMDNNGTSKYAALAASNGLFVLRLDNSQLNGTLTREPGLKGNMGLMYVDPTEMNLATDNIKGGKAVQISSTVPWNGVGGLARGPSAPLHFDNVKVPAGVATWPANRAFPNVATIKFSIGQGALLIDIKVKVPAGVDIDIGVNFDQNGNGVLDQSDPVMVSASQGFDNGWTDYPVAWKDISGHFGVGVGADEECKVLKPGPAGDYFLVMNSFSAVATVSPSVDITVVQGLGFTTSLPIKGVNGAADIDPTPLPPNQNYKFNLNWNFSGVDLSIHRPGPRQWADATYLGVLYVGPSNNPMAFLIPITLNLERGKYPKILNIKPPNNAVINDRYPVIGADIATAVTGDPVGIDTTSEMLWIDGVLQSDASKSTTGIIMKPTTPLSDGVHQVEVQVSNLAGVTNSTMWNFTVSTTIPSLTVTSPTQDLTYTNQSSYLITGSTSTTGNINVTVNGVPVAVKADGSFSTQVTLADNSLNGKNDVIVATTNDAGNTRYVNKSIVRDILAPQFNQLIPETTGLRGATSYTNNSKLLIVGTIDLTNEYNNVWDISQSKVEVKNGATVTTLASQADGTFSGTVNLTAGLNSLQILAIDDAGNTVTVAKNVIFDTTPPTIEVTSSTSSGSDTYTIEGKVTDNYGVDRLIVNGKDVPLNNGSFSTDVTLMVSGGQNTITIVAIDYAGNQAVKEFQVNFGGTPTLLIVGSIAIIVIAIVLVVLFLVFAKKKKPSAPVKEEAKPGEPAPAEAPKPETLATPGEPTTPPPPPPATPEEPTTPPSTTTPPVPTTPPSTPPETPPAPTPPPPAPAAPPPAPAAPPPAPAAPPPSPAPPPPTPSPPTPPPSV